LQEAATLAEKRRWRQPKSRSDTRGHADLRSGCAERFFFYVFIAGFGLKQRLFFNQILFV
jgi:hypothetical protein